MKATSWKPSGGEEETAIDEKRGSEKSLLSLRGVEVF